MNSLRDEIIQKYYPDGIDQTLRASDGTEIKTAQDIVDMGLTKTNGEEFTYEEAAQWIMDQRQSISRNLDEIKDNAALIAETQNLLDGMDIIRAEYGDLAASIPERLTSRCQICTSRHSLSTKKRYRNQRPSRYS